MTRLIKRLATAAAAAAVLHTLGLLAPGQLARAQQTAEVSITLPIAHDLDGN